MPVKKPGSNELLDALREFGRALAKRPPGDGWFTLEELATAQGVERAAVRYRIHMARKGGKVKIETATGTALDAEGNARRTSYYRLGEKS